MMTVIRPDYYIKIGIKGKNEIVSTNFEDMPEEWRTKKAILQILKKAYKSFKKANKF